ncbi:restriction endonuclease subunit S [Nocardia farcinica]|uniref:restriction endonuclease subunit S n=1 Tax=Nocardia farcinica TaxID=37329 RepID=UPI00189381F8|nr:restriction endonuclease subunit S [Nocardia farcinica]MBF6258178.1 restriction endonuclease subunit S [Nocardia farcinica]
MTSLPTAELGSVATINPRLSRPFEDDEMVSFLGMADVSEDGTTSAGIDRPFSDVRRGYTPFKNGDVLIAKITPCFENGKIVQADVTRDYGFGSTEFHVVRTGDGLDPRYLLHYLRRPSVRVDGERRMTGSGGQRRVPAEYVKNLRIPLPPIEEQRRIAAILDHADALRAKRREALDRLDELTQSIFIDMFGDPVSNPKGWPTLRIGELAKVTTGNTPSRERDEYYGRHIEWIKSDNINTSSAMLTAAAEYLSELGASVARIAPKGSILMTCIAGSPSVIGNVAIADRPVAFNQQINAILPLNGQTWFWYEQLRLAKTLVQAASTGGMKGLVSKSKLESVALLFPPVELQQSFSTRVSEVVRFKSHHIAAVASLDALFASLQSRAFRGEL